jgi:hypothetical protein
MKDCLDQNSSRSRILTAASIVMLGGTVCAVEIPEQSNINSPLETVVIATPDIQDLITKVVIEDEIQSSQKACETSELEAVFNGLVKNWREATGGYSLTMRRYAHASYQSILALEPKKDVITLVLRELQQRPDRWFEALKALTKTNPAQNAKTFDETVQCWIEWGKMEKYIS